MRINRIFGIFLITLIVFCCFTTVYADPDTDTVVLDPIVIPSVVFVKEMDLEGLGEGVLCFTDETDNVLFSVESEEFERLTDEMYSDIKEDSLKGLEQLSISKVTLDHIRLNTWGEFLNKYHDKKLSNFPVGDIHIKYDDRDFTIVNTELARKLVSEKIIPILIQGVEEVSKNYPVKRYALDIDNGFLLKDYEFDLTSVREVETIYPLDNMESYVIYNVGSYYGFSLSSDYVKILRGYIEGENTGYDRPIQGQYPGCVNVLAYITLLKNISGGILTDKEISDFTIYENLAIRLDTKELIDTSDMTTNNKILTFSDFKLDPDILLLTPISEDVVVVQPTYLECFYYKGVNRNFGRKIDVTPFVAEGKQEVSVGSGENLISIPISYFADSKGRLDTQLGNSPFLIYYSSHVPYDLLINWAYNQAGTNFEDKKDRDAFVNKIKSDMYSEDRQVEFKQYMKDAGQGTNILVLLVLGVVIISAIGGVVYILQRKKLKEKVEEITNNDLLFDSYEDDEDEEDIETDFELK